MNSFFKFFTKVACGLWDIDIPENTNTIADKGDETEVDIEHLQLGMRFYADMLNRFLFLVITVTIFIAFFCTFVQSWVRYSL